jgi:hypothetical protein
MKKRRFKSGPLASQEACCHLYVNGEDLYKTRALPQAKCALVPLWLRPPESVLLSVLDEDLYNTRAPANHQVACCYLHVSLSDSM